MEIDFHFISIQFIMTASLQHTSPKSQKGICLSIHKNEGLSHRLLKEYRHPITENLQLFFSQSHDERLSEVLAYTYSNYDDHISIEQVAKIANLTKESFCRYFKSRAQKTYLEFLTELRISKACQMIKRGDQSVKEIGYSCGFDSLSNFYDRFKKIMKLSPLEFKYLCSDER